jgi:hypothetical protein
MRGKAAYIRQSGGTLPRTMRKPELCAPGCLFTDFLVTIFYYSTVKELLMPYSM